jgi:hypothetical protein
MIGRRHKRFRWAAGLAALAILLQSLIPLLHHPAGMALAGTTGFGGGRNLCLAPGSVPAPADLPDKSPAHHIPACALCQAVHAIGGFAPPAATSLTIAPRYATIVAPHRRDPAPARLCVAQQRARAPPIPA